MSRYTVLVVEDEEDISELIRYNLDREGYNVVTTASGEEGLDAARRSQPDVVLLDLMLPGVDGLEVCRRLKSEPQTATACWSRDGDLTIWTSTQGSFGVRDQVATLLRVPVSQVRVVPMEMGGGCGGKGQIYLEPLAALLSRETGRTVKMTMTASVLS